MSEEVAEFKELEKLKSLGAQKIHEQTHISLRYVEAILYESFEGMQKVQLMGFISILEREYNVDLTQLKADAQEYFDQQKEKLAQKEEPHYKKELLVSSDKAPVEKKYLLYGAIAVVVLLFSVIGYSFFNHPSSSNATIEQNTTQSTMEQNVTIAIPSTPEQNTTEETPIEEEQIQELQQKHILRVLPKKKVWVGWIDLETKKKKQTVTIKPIELNASKSYLFTFGHGYIDIELDDTLKEFSQPKAVKFLYKDGELKQITSKEFKQYNQGKLW